jgi:hypothetical protein
MKQFGPLFRYIVGNPSDVSYDLLYPLISRVFVFSENRTMSWNKTTLDQKIKQNKKIKNSYCSGLGLEAQYTRVPSVEQGRMGWSLSCTRTPVNWQIPCESWRPTSEWWTFTAHQGSSVVFWQPLMVSANGFGPALGAILTLWKHLFHIHFNLSVGAPAGTQLPSHLSEQGGAKPLNTEYDRL